MVASPRRFAGAALAAALLLGASGARPAPTAAADLTMSAKSPLPLLLNSPNIPFYFLVRPVDMPAWASGIMESTTGHKRGQGSRYLLPAPSTNFC